jgi:hypothetical protein
MKSQPEARLRFVEEEDDLVLYCENKTTRPLCAHRETILRQRPVQFGAGVDGAREHPRHRLPHHQD